MKKQYPTADRLTFILSEDVRREESGKATIIGAFLGENIIVNEPKGEGAEIISCMAFTFIFNDGVGSFQTAVSVTAPDGVIQVDAYSTGLLVKNENASLNILFRISPFQVKDGTYKVTVHLDDRTYDRYFSIKHSQ